MRRLIWVLLTLTTLMYFNAEVFAKNNTDLALLKKEPKKNTGNSEIKIENFRTMFPGAAYPSNDANFLSLELSRFSAESIENQYVILDWSIKEMKMLPDQFIIEKWSAQLDWIELQTINGVEDNSDINAFSFLDRYPESGNSFYRLKYVDDAGNTYATEIKTVITYDEEKFSFSRDYDNAMVSLLNHDKKEDLNTLKVLDIKGNNVTNLVKIEKTKENERSLNLQNLESGMYIVKTTNFSTKHFKL